MNLPRSVAEVLQEHVTLESESIDRMYLNVYVPQLQRVGGVVWFMRGHLGQRFASTATVAPRTEAFVKGIERFARRHRIDVVSFAKGERKDEVTQRYLARSRRRDGVLYIGRAQERARVVRTERRRFEGREGSWPWIVDPAGGVQALLHALVLFVFLARGFSNKDLREQLAPLLGLDPSEMRPGRMSYDLRRLRLHGLIERLPGTHRYRLTDLGLRTALFYTRVYGRILRPGFALISPRAPDERPQLHRSFRAVEAAINSWCEQAKIAA